MSHESRNVGKSVEFNILDLMEGPSIVILTEECQKFVGKRVIGVTGIASSFSIRSLRAQKLKSVGSWGKHFILEFEKITLRIHFMMFGSYTIDIPKPDRISRLKLKFKSGELFTYACAVKVLDQPLGDLYDWREDVMSSRWSEKLAVSKLSAEPSLQLCDVLLHQDVFAGAGNIFKNEVLYALKLRPEVRVSSLTQRELILVAREMRLYALKFYKWKKAFELRKNWKVYKRKTCAVCGTKTAKKTTGDLERRSHFCPKCQKPRSRRPSGSANDALVQTRLRGAAREISRLKREIAPLARSSAAEKEP